MHPFVQFFVLTCTFGLASLAHAAENLPLLRVDPALLGIPLEGRTADSSADRAPAATTDQGEAATPSTAVVEPPASAATEDADDTARTSAAQVEKIDFHEPTAVNANAPAHSEPSPERAARPVAAEPAEPAALSAQRSPLPRRPGAAAPVIETKKPAAEKTRADKVVAEKTPVAPAAVPAPAPEPARAAAPPPTTQAEAVPAAVPRSQVEEPPLVAEQPALPPLYSAHARAGLLQGRPQGTTLVIASRIDGRRDQEVIAEGEAELHRDEAALTADRLTYWPVEDEMEAEGNVHYAKQGDRLSGPKMHLNLTDNTGSFDQPQYSVTRAKRREDSASETAVPGAVSRRIRKAPSFVPYCSETNGAGVAIAGDTSDDDRLVTGSGRADHLELQGENRMRFTNATYSTCAAEDPDWYARATQLDLDFDQQVGEGREAAVIFKGVPLFYTPWISFSLNNQRKSGFLAPTFGVSSRSGVEFSLPYYWDIAPNMDLTVTPRLMTKRGLQVNSEFRYLDYDYKGLARLEWLPNDRVLGRKRFGYSLLHEHTNLGYGFSGLVNLNGVSDGRYLRDLSTRITESSQGNMLRQGVLNYSGWWGSASLNLQTYQTLQDPDLPPAIKPYQRLPQITVVSNRPEFIGGTSLAFSGEYVNFDHPTLDTARRLTLYPQLSLPWIHPGWYVTPKIGLHSTRYDISRKQTSGPDHIVRNLPIFSVDAGMTFERDLNWFDKGLTQTLEPRLFYLLVPQRTQDDIPIFDSGLSDFNFATIFSDNVYTGVDRVADANQITAALTSRLIDPQTGEEYVRGMVGQRYYFARQHVTMPGEPARPGGTSDFLAAISGRVAPRTIADAAWQYDPRDRQTERFSIGARWQPDFAKVLNASYRYTRDHTGMSGTPGIRQVDFSAQWPLANSWYGVGRFNYSIREKKIVEALGGLEYNGGCWVGRAVLQRYATSSGTTNTAFFIQLELNDFSSIGSNPLELLSRRIPGYGRINQPAANPVFGYD